MSHASLGVRPSRSRMQPPLRNHDGTKGRDKCTMGHLTRPSITHSPTNFLVLLLGLLEIRFQLINFGLRINSLLLGSCHRFWPETCLQLSDLDVKGEDHVTHDIDDPTRNTQPELHDTGPVSPEMARVLQCPSTGLQGGIWFPFRQVKHLKGIKCLTRGPSFHMAQVPYQLWAPGPSSYGFTPGCPNQLLPLRVACLYTALFKNGLPSNLAGSRAL
ncbi:hypothetical protein BHE74_00045836 [Ensete ventricosum]|nr:hypothetical protein BHE74_00045836 [Ensete ventricosum]